MTGCIRASAVMVLATALLAGCATTSQNSAAHGPPSEWDNVWDAADPLEKVELGAATGFLWLLTAAAKSGAHYSFSP